ncbi:hypothetical protein F5Y14DRAFT_29927 [Nemania sp. NC0429]|nr:hypothetical protein F5Y14DRAFT_29927 [Nemania sp. NC0429]
MKRPVLWTTLSRPIGIWSRTKAFAIDFPQRFKILLRSLGLGLVTLVKQEEPRKILVYRSRLLTLAHCAVHIFPAAASFVLIGLNFQGRFIGEELQGTHFTTDDVKLGSIQVAAKLHELLIVASLSTIIFHVLRLNLIYGHGVPLGFLGSGWTFSQITYFFSPEFWGGALSNSPGLTWKEYLFAPLILVSGLVATFAGPATAVLATPRTSDWPVGGGSYWLNGSEAQLWPRNLDNTAIENYNCSTIEAKIYDPKCPSAGYESLYQHFKTWWQFPDYRSMLEYNMQDYSMIKTIYAAVFQNEYYDTAAWTSHWATAMLQDAKRDLYDNSLVWLRDHYRHDPPYPGYLDVAAKKTFTVQTKIPFVRTACMSRFTIDITDETIASPIPMPFPARTQGWEIARDLEKPYDKLVPYSSQEVDTVAIIQRHFRDRGFFVSEENGNMTLSNDIPAVVAIPMDLPPIAYATGLGIIVLVREASTTTFGCFACAVDSMWTPGKSIIEATRISNGGAHDFRKDRVRNVVTTNSAVRGAAVPMYFDNENVIRIHSGWYELLSPTLPDSVEYGSLRPGRVSSSTSRSLMERLLEVVLYPLFEGPTDGLPSVRSVEYVASAYIADGLSRCGSTIQNNVSGVIGQPSFRSDDSDMARSLVFKGSPEMKGMTAKPDLLKNHDATEMLMTAVFTGYLLAVIGSFDYFAVFVLLFHAAMALSYTVLVFIFDPEIMEALDTIPEMVAMAQNSPPPDNDSLRNTSTGIRSRKTLGRVAIVETSMADDRSDGKEELVLRFQDTARDAGRIPKVGQEYGAIK